MKIIQINRKTIKKNRDAGATKTCIKLGEEITFSGNRNLINKSLEEDKDYFITEEDFDGNVSGCLYDPGLVDVLIKKGIKISRKISYQEVNHLPNPAYSFKYKNTRIKCTSCNKGITIKKLEELSDYDGEGNMLRKCPKCGEYDSFEEFRYEKISEIK